MENAKSVFQPRAFCYKLGFVIINTVCFYSGTNGSYKNLVKGVAVLTGQGQIS